LEKSSDMIVTCRTFVSVGVL